MSDERPAPSEAVGPTQIEIVLRSVLTAKEVRPAAIEAAIETVRFFDAEQRRSLVSLRDSLDLLAQHWISEGKRCYELAHKTRKVEETVLAQSVRFFECGRELQALIAEKLGDTK